MIKVALTAGHDKYRMRGASATSKTLGRKISENEFWNDFIDEIMPLIQNMQGIEFKQFHRANQKPIGYSKAMRIEHDEIDKWGADIDLELHFNAGGVKATGHEVVYYRASKGGLKYATVLDKSFDRYLNNRDRNRKPVTIGERGSYGLRIGKSYSLITEAFFAKEIDNFLPGGSQRENLINSYLDFFAEIINIK